MALRSALARALFRFVVVLTALIVTAVVFADGEQKWAWTHTIVNGRQEQATDSVVDATGNTYVVGWDELEGSVDRHGMIAKVDPSGNLLWLKYFTDSDPATEELFLKVKLSASGVYAGGIIGTAALVVKYDASGNETWEKVVQISGSDFTTFRDLAVDSNDGVAFCGYSYTSSLQLKKQMLAERFDSAGNVKWQRQTRAGSLFFQTFDSSNNLLCLGAAEGVDAGFVPPCIVKYNAAGDVVYNVVTDKGTGTFLMTDTGGNLYVPIMTGFPEWGIRKYGPTGNIIFTKSLDNNIEGQESYPATGKIDASGNLYLVGSYQQMFSDVPITFDAIWKLNSSTGIVQWNRMFQLPYQPADGEYLFGRNNCAIDANGFIYHSGSYDDENGVTHVLLSKFDSTGKQYWGNLLVTDDTNTIPMAMNVDGSGNVLLGAVSKGPMALKVVKVGENQISNFVFENFINGSGSSTGTVTMLNPAPVGGLNVNVTTTPGLTVPTNFTIAAGSKIGSFTVSGTNSSADVSTPTVTVSALGSKLKATIQIYPANGAQFVTQTVPPTMQIGKTYVVNLQFKNTGLTTWDTAHQYNVHTVSPPDNLTWKVNRLPLTNGPIQPGGIGIFSGTVTAPSVGGTYTFFWQPIEDLKIHAGFGQSSKALSIVVSSVFDDAAFVSRTGSTGLYVGTSFYVQNTMTNTGTTTWTTAAGYSLMSINPNNNTTWHISNIAIPGATASVAPNTNVTFTGQCIAPITPGTYTMQWQVNKSGNPFGAPTPITTINVYPSPDKAQYVSKIIPSTILAGASFTGRVTMKNTGTTTWTQAAGYCLISQNPYNNKTWGTNRLLVPGSASVTPGSSIELFNTLTAPVTPGTYFMGWQMYKNGVVFGDLSPILSINVIANPDKAQFIGQQSFSTVVAGASLKMQVAMANTGSTTWTQAGGYCMLSQSPSNNTIWGTNRLLIPSSASVAPGSLVNCLNTLKAPATPGTYAMQWRMYHNGVLFGDVCPLQMVTVTVASHVTLQRSALEQWMVLAEDAVALLDMKREN